MINTMWRWMGVLGIAWESGIVSPYYNVYRPSSPTMMQLDILIICAAFPDMSAELIRYSKGVWKSRLRTICQRNFC